jgi:hypothetical protein
VRLLAAILIGAAILALGILVLRSVASGRPREEAPPEDVAGLEVYFVCGECGTEFKVERLGQLQVPRHCGELMNVERRPRATPAPG